MAHRDCSGRFCVAVLLAATSSNFAFSGSGFEPPTMSSPVAAPEERVLETTQPSVEAENSYGVYLFAGEVFFEQEDLRIRGRGFDFVWRRKYRSREGITTPMGVNWDHSYNIYIEAASSDLILHDGNTRRDVYTPNGTDRWAAPGLFREIVRNADSSFTVIFSHFTKWNLAPLIGTTHPGRITSIVDRNGNTMTFAYNGSGQLTTITDTLNRPITVSYDTNGYISAIEDFAMSLGPEGQGRRVTYTYYVNADNFGGDGDLRTVTFPKVVNTPNGNNFPDGKTWTFSYTENQMQAERDHNLATVRDAKGQTYLFNFYTTTKDPGNVAFDKVLGQRMGFGLNAPRFDYTYVDEMPGAGNNGAEFRTIVNDRIGNVEELFYDELNRLVLRREYTGRWDASVPTLPTELESPDTPRLRSTDPAYFETLYGYNGDSLLTSVLYPRGNSVEYRYDSGNMDVRSRGNLLTKRSDPGGIPSDQPEICERWAYDSVFNFPTTHADPRDNRTEWFYASSGARGSLPNNCDEPTLASRIDSAPVESKSDVLLLGPGNTGNLTSTNCPPMLFNHPLVFLKPALGGCEECFEYSYNAFGQLVSRVNRRGRQDNFTYYDSQAGPTYLASRTEDVWDEPLTTEYEYDEVGNLTKLIAARANVPKNPEPSDTIYYVNALDQVVRIESPPVTKPGGGTVRYQRDYHYDLNDNLDHVDVQNVDDSGNVDSVNPHFTTSYTYDNLDNLTQITREVDLAHNVVTQYVYDNNENLTLTRFGQANASPPNQQAANVVRTEWDERDLKFKAIRAEGDAAQSTMRFDYDWNGNLVTSSQGTEGTPRVYAFGFDGYDRPGTATDPEDNATLQTYDFSNSHLTLTTALVGEDVDGYSGRVAEQSKVVREYDNWNRPSKVDYRFVSPRKGSVVRNELDPDPGASSSKLGHAVWAFGYDSEGNMVLYCPARGLATATHMSHDAHDREISRQSPDGTTSVCGWNPNHSPTDFFDNEQCESEKDPKEFHTGNEYDALERLIATTDNDSKVRRFRYDSRNNLALYTDAKGIRTRYEYDGLSRLVRTIRDMDDDGPSAADAADIVITQNWDDSSRLIAQTDDNGNSTSYLYDPLNRVVRVVFADGTEQNYEYDVHDNPIEVSDARGSVSENTFDLLDRLVGRDITPGSGVSDNTTEERFRYDAMSRVVYAEDNDSTVTRVYDSMGNIVEETIFSGVPICGNSIVEPGEECDPPDVPACSATCFLPDPGDCCVQLETPGCSNSTIAECVCAVDPYCCEKDWHISCAIEVNKLGCGDCNPKPLPPPANSMTALYDGVGNLRTLSYPGGRVVGYVYDTSNRLEAITDSSVAGDLMNYGYCGPLRVDGATAGNSVQSLHNYDNVRRPVAITHELGASTIASQAFAWDESYNKTSRTNVNSDKQHTFEYDDAYRLVKTTVDAAGTPMAPFDRQTTYNLDGVHNRISVTGSPDAGPHVGTYTMSSASPPDDFECNQYTTTPAGCREYDDNGNLIRSGQRREYADIVPACGDGFIDISEVLCVLAGYEMMSACPRGDIAPCGGDGIIEAADLFAILDAFSGIYACPSACGFEVAGCDTKLLAYDYHNRMVEFVDHATDTRHTYAYDAFGRRIKKVVDADGSPQETRYFYGGPSAWQVIEEQDGEGNTLATYVWGRYIDELVSMRRCPPGQTPTGSNLCSGGLPPVDYYFHLDDIDSVLTVTDSFGGVVERYEYGDFGKPQFLTPGGATATHTCPDSPPGTCSAIGNPYLFTGREYDAETGLYNYRTRNLDSVAGGFTTRDTIGVWGSSSGLGNGAAYATGSPWTFVDPYGEDVVDWVFTGYWNPPIPGLTEAAKDAFAESNWDRANGTLEGVLDHYSEGFVDSFDSFTFDEENRNSAQDTAKGIIETAERANGAAGIVKGMAKSLKGGLRPGLGALEDAAEKKAKVGARGGARAGKKKTEAELRDELKEIERKLEKRAARAAKRGEKIETHHGFPQQRGGSFFRGQGLDPEKFKVRVPQRKHRLRPDGIHTGRAKDGKKTWHREWDEFERNFPDATARDMLQKLRDMYRDRFDLSVCGP